MKYIAIGAATIALAVSPALAQGKGNGNGNGNGNAPGQSAKAQGKPDKGPRGGDQARGNGNGNGEGDVTVIKNSQYWIAEEIIVAKSDRARFRAFGRNWNFEGRSAEVCKLDWHS